MQLKMATFSTLLFLSACGACPPQRPPVAIRQYTTPDQEEIAREHNILTDKPLFDQQGNRVYFPLTPIVFDDWETMRRELH